MEKFAFVFPGQGSQFIGMLKHIAKKYELIETTFREASVTLGYNLWSLTQQGPDFELNKTCQTQVALLTASVALWRLWCQKGGKQPTLMAGHSLGEYSVLVCTGVISFIDAVKLVRFRGELMQSAVSEGTGAMAVIIGLETATVAQICKEQSQRQVVSLVNFNSPLQIVIAGQKKPVNRAMIACKKAGAKRVLVLPVSVPSHCCLMKPVAEKLENQLNNITFNKPNIPFINNVDVKVETDSVAIRQALVRQIYSPVQWQKSIELMLEKGIGHFYEVGPGRVLTNLVKQISKKTGFASTFNDFETLEKLVERQIR